MVSLNNVHSATYERPPSQPLRAAQHNGRRYRRCRIADGRRWQPLVVRGSSWVTQRRGGVEVAGLPRQCLLWGTRVDVARVGGGNRWRGRDQSSRVNGVIEPAARSWPIMDECPVTAGLNRAHVSRHRPPAHMLPFQQAVGTMLNMGICLTAGCQGVASSMPIPCRAQYRQIPASGYACRNR